MEEEKKIRYIRRLPPCPNYDVERLESWLSDIAKEGLILAESSSILGFLPFTKGAPQNIRYRLEPKPKEDGTDSEAPDRDIRELCREYGWEFVTAYNLFYIFRATRPDAREMNTDLTVQAAALKNIKRQFTLNILLQLILIGNTLWRAFREFTRYLVTFGGFYTFGMVTLLVGVLVADIVRAVHIRKLQKKLKANIPLDHNKPWKKGARWRRGWKIAVVIFYLAVLCTLFTRCASVAAQEGTPLSDFPADPPFVTITDLFPDGTYTAQKMNSYNEYTLWESEFSAVNIEWDEYGKIVTAEGITYSGFLCVKYHETSADFIAQGLAGDYMQADSKYSDCEEIALPDLGVDYAICYRGAACPVVILRQGSTLVHATILVDNTEKGNLHLLWAELMAQRLLNG